MALVEAVRSEDQADAQVRDRVLTLPQRFRPEAADGFAADFALDVGGEVYRVAIARGRCSVRPEDPPFASARIVTDRDTWLALDAGEISSIDAFLQDRIAVRGNVEYAVRMQSLFHFTGRRRSPQDLEHRPIRVGRHVLSSFVFGQGRPVLLLHGLAATKLSYLPLLPALARDHRVIVPDLPGHGESTKPRADYTPSYFARVIHGLLDELEVDRAAVIGNSMGGRVALEVAADLPDRVSSLILLDPAAAGVPFPLYARLLRMLPTGVGAVPIPLRKRIVAYGIRTLFAAPDRLPRAAYLAGADEFIRVYRHGRARVALLSAMRGLMKDRRDSFWERMAEIDVRTLILWGSEDRLVPVRLGRRLAATMPRAELVVLPGVGHVPQFEVPEEIRRLVQRFLEPG
ncbi:MAG TPA: alpha/beta fold hydrolase [Actinomycetota bacterium]|nr:alpha/beta fold hydrolase [Actinomycetota bacterium]